MYLRVETEEKLEALKEAFPDKWEAIVGYVDALVQQETKDLHDKITKRGRWSQDY